MGISIKTLATKFGGPLAVLVAVAGLGWATRDYVARAETAQTALAVELRGAVDAAEKRLQARDQDQRDEILKLGARLDTALALAAGDRDRQIAMLAEMSQRMQEATAERKAQRDVLDRLSVAVAALAAKAGLHNAGS